MSGRRASGDEGHTYLHRGIAARDFERRSELADYVVVRSAQHADSLLSIDLAREAPEALKPRRIEIGAPGATSEPKRIGDDKSDRQAA